jgi:hypothetical protein
VKFLKLSRLHTFACAPDPKKQAQGGRGEVNNKHKNPAGNADEKRGTMRGRALDFCGAQTQRAPK